MMLEALIAGATVELVSVGVILAALVLAWMFMSGFIDEYGPMIGLTLALGVGTVAPSLYIIFAISGQ